MDKYSAVGPVFVGIDVAKDRLDVHLLPSGETFAVPRDHAGLESLAARLAQAVPALGRVPPRRQADHKTRAGAIAETIRGRSWQFLGHIRPEGL
jgi:hypothetical protein